MSLWLIWLSIAKNSDVSTNLSRLESKNFPKYVSLFWILAIVPSIASKKLKNIIKIIASILRSNINKIEPVIAPIEPIIVIMLAFKSVLKIKLWRDFFKYI